MNVDGLHRRHPEAVASTNPIMPAGAKEKLCPHHPAGPVKHSGANQLLRMMLFGLYFLSGCLCIFVTQMVGAPLYFYSKDYFYAWMAVTKQHFSLLVTTMTQWWSPTVVRVSADKSVRGQLRETADGRLECDFPERIILISNHQIYTDWLYLWWIAYTSGMHGYLYIILKESLKYIPLMGQGMKFYGFVFLARKWAKDKPRFQHHLQRLKGRHHGPMSGAQELDPMWLLIFPEGTNMSQGGRASSKRWSEKNGWEDLEHVLWPRSTGLQFCLSELKGTVEWVYDCTVAYEGIPRGEYGQDIFTLYSTFFQGRPPKSVNIHLRRFAVSSIPVSDPKAFEDWLHQRWIEKNQILEQYWKTGRLPANEEVDSPMQQEQQNGYINGRKMPLHATGTGYIETEVKPKNPFEFIQVFLPPITILMLAYEVWKFWRFIGYWVDKR